METFLLNHPSYKAVLVVKDEKEIVIRIDVFRYDSIKICVVGRLSEAIDMDLVKTPLLMNVARDLGISYKLFKKEWRKALHEKLDSILRD